MIYAPDDFKVDGACKENVWILSQQFKICLLFLKLDIIMFMKKNILHWLWTANKIKNKFRKKRNQLFKG